MTLSRAIERMWHSGIKHIYLQQKRKPRENDCNLQVILYNLQLLIYTEESLLSKELQLELLNKYRKNVQSREKAKPARFKKSIFIRIM